MKTISALALLLSVHATYGQPGKPIVLEPEIEGVTVYLSGGEVRSSAALDLANGTNTVILKGLSPHTFPQSVQVTVKGELEILSVSTAGDFLDAGKPLHHHLHVRSNNRVTEPSEFLLILLPHALVKLLLADAKFPQEGLTRKKAPRKELPCIRSWSSGLLVAFRAMSKPGKMNT